MPLKSFRLDSGAKRFAPILLAIMLLAAFYFTAKWSLANTFSARSESRDISQFAIDLSPNDPQTHYSLAVMNEKSLMPDDFPKAVESYEKAASLSPYNYLLWIALGKARERNGDNDGAEKALRKALELAPNYSESQWTLGNILLRSGKAEEAFASIRKAAESDPKYIRPAVSAAFQNFGGDIPAIMERLGESIRLKASLANFLAKENRADEAISIWNALPESERKANLKEEGRELVRSLLASKKIRAANLIQSQIADGESRQMEIAKFTNPGFESEIDPLNTDIFKWLIADGAQPQIGIDEKQKAEGGRSLVILFNSADGKDFRQVSQTLAIESSKKYEFQAFYRSDMKGPPAMKWEIADAASNKILASSSPIAPISDWQEISVSFDSAPDTEAIIVRLVKLPCPAKSCPLVGKVWFDGFSLQ